MLNFAGLRQTNSKHSKLAAAINFLKSLTLKKKTTKIEPMIEMTIDTTTRYNNEEKKENLRETLT